MLRRPLGILCREGLGTSDEVEGYSRDDPSLIMRAYLPPDESLQGEVIGISRKNTGTSTVDPSTNPNSLSAPSFLPGTVPPHRIVKLDWTKGSRIGSMEILKAATLTPGCGYMKGLYVECGERRGLVWYHTVVYGLR